jgi:hypothetical protein
MTSQLRLLTESDDPAYERLVLDAPQGMFVHSLTFGRFLSTLLPDATGFRLGVFSNGQLKAAIPAFARPGRFGTVVNSLPFFGSHGGVLTAEDCDEDLKRKLLLAFSDHCVNLGAVSTTIIEAPFPETTGCYETLPRAFDDDRIGQWTRLPDRAADDVREAVLANLHHKTRNMVRKAEREDFDVTLEVGLGAIRQLHHLHEANMQVIGGRAKPWQVYETIHEVFHADRDYRLYVARHPGGDVAAALLLFFYKDTVEYFTPAISAAHRHAQPLSLLIFRAMVDAVAERGARWWNWGGTWRSQAGVHRFKASWGAEERVYRYHVITGEGFDALAKHSSGEILEAYPYFYTFPFK